MKSKTSLIALTSVLIFILVVTIMTALKMWGWVGGLNMIIIIGCSVLTPVLSVPSLLGILFLFATWTTIVFAPEYSIESSSHVWPILLGITIGNLMRYGSGVWKALLNALITNRVFQAMILFGVLCLASAPFSHFPDIAVRRAFGYLIVFFFFWVLLPFLCRVRGGVNFNHLVRNVHLAIFSLVVYEAILLVMRPGEVTSYTHATLQRFQGITGNPNTHAAVVLLQICLAMVGYVISRRRLVRLLYGGCSLVGFSLLIASGSRTSLLAFFVVVLSIAILEKRKGFVWISAASLIFSLIMYLVPRNPVTSLARGSSPIRKIMRLDTDILASRWPLWHRIISRIGDSTVIWGEGLGSLTRMPLGITRAHNIYLELFIETGILGSLLFLGAVFYIVLQLYRRIEGGRTAEERSIFRCSLALLLGLLAHGFGESLFLSPPNPFFHMFLVISMVLMVPLVIERGSDGRMQHRGG